MKPAGTVPGLPTLRRPLSIALQRLVAHPLTVIVLLFAASRAVLVLVGLLTFQLLMPEADRSGEGIVALLCRWDCGWYTAIAEHGYRTLSADGQPGATSFAFFPVYPWLMHVVQALTGRSLAGAGVLVSNLAFLGALVYVHRYAVLLGLGSTVGLLAVALLCFVPQSFVFSAVYTESLFLLLLAAAMFHLRRGDFLLAGLLAAVLSATRANGVFFVFFALLWIARTHGVGAVATPWRDPRVFVPVLLAPLGLFCFWAFCFARTGDAFAQASSIAHGWGWYADAPFDNLVAHMREGAQPRFWALSSLAVFACSLLLLRHRLYEEFGLCLAMFALLWSSALPNSLLRYSIVLFPAWIALAATLVPRPALAAGVFGSFALINGFLMAAWTLGRPITI